ncbi:MAG: PD-(D/E)XK nuclease family protein [Spirochaetaceae bacterium]|nr:MAG: PD-(D/E)XK nuclease family protein [Spirochaetaceae bacterium]
MRKSFTQQILDAVDARRAVVFPSEVAAAFWRREAVRTGTRRAVREDLLLSWDRFKETAFDLRTDLLPANQTIRAVFVARLIAENARSPFLRWLIPEAFADRATGFGPSIARALPSVRAATALPVSASARLAGLVADAREIDRRYQGFLDQHGLYEPRWLATAPAYRGGDHLLVFPELTEDFPDFEPAVAHLPRVAVPGDRLPVAGRHRDARAEVDSLLDRIARLLDDGVPADRVVVTVCDLDALRRRLVHAAELAAVPLSFRQGLPLDDSAPGRLFAAMGDLVADGFGVESLKPLVLNRAVPWTDYTVNGELVLAGVAAGCIGGRSRPDPRWRAIDEKRYPRAPAMIRALESDITAIVSAKTAADLRSRLNGFLSRAIDRDGWHPDDQAIVERSLEELRSIAETESRLGVTVPDPFQLWLSRLREQRYAPRRAPSGVAVLDYRVGAGVCPDYHFAINAHHAAMSVRIPRFPFLGDVDRDALGPAGEDRDLSRDFALAYAASGASVCFSFSSVGHDGPNLPPGLFVADRLIDDAPAPPRSPYRIEEGRSDSTPAADSDVAGASTTVLPLQADGVSAYTATIGPPGLNAMTDPIGDEALIAALVARQADSGDAITLRVSASDLESFRACPFSYLLQRPLGVGELDLTIDPDSARDIGTYYHRLFERFFKELHDERARFDPSRIDEYVERLGRIAAEPATRPVGMVPGFVYDAIARRASLVAVALLRIDSAVIAGHAPEYVESWRSRYDDSLNAQLVGRFDRTTRSPDGSLTLVDYKKRTVPTGSSQSGGAKEPVGIVDRSPAERIDAAAAITSMQIPFYVRLIESNGEHVGAAYYYSLEDGSALPVYTEAASEAGDDTAASIRGVVMSRERMEEVIVLMNDALEQMVSRIRSGDYRCGQTCDGCRYRAICRTGFVVQ